MAPRRRAKRLTSIVDRVLKRVHLLRMRIIHLLHNMQHYCKVEVPEGCWAVLEREMAEADDIDGMILAHARYLTMVKDMTLQSDRSRYAATELNAVLDTVPRFSEMQKEICAWALHSASSTSSLSSPRLEQKRNDDVDNDDNGNGTEDEKDDEEEKKEAVEKEIEKDGEKLLSKLAEIELEFDERYAKLLGVLTTHCQMVDVCVFLLLRLDFNEYYARKEHESETDVAFSPSQAGEQNGIESDDDDVDDDLDDLSHTPSLPLDSYFSMADCSFEVKEN